MTFVPGIQIDHANFTAVRYPKCNFGRLNFGNSILSFIQ